MVTKREWLVSKGLAKPGRGKFSAEAIKEIEKAESEGMVFDLTAAEKYKIQREAAPAKVRPPKKEKVSRPDNSLYDVKSVRAWAARKGIQLATRGRISSEVISSYLSENGEKKAVSRKPRVAVSKKRNEIVGYTYARRNANDPKFISEPLVAVSNCGACHRGVAMCGCSSGPTAPKYLGGEALMLTRPTG